MTERWWCTDCGRIAHVTARHTYLCPRCLREWPCNSDAEEAR